MHSSNTVIHSYLAELRNIAINLQSLSHDTLEKLKRAPILAASKRIQEHEPDRATGHVGSNKGDLMEYDLCASNQVAVVDDMIAYQQFGGVVFCAPQETILEGEFVS